MKNITKFSVISISSFLAIQNSEFIDVGQLIADIERFYTFENLQLSYIYFLISILISCLTLYLMYFLKPFIEIYLLYYFRFSFYFLINLLSISTVFIILRIYGYSRLNLLIYLIFSSFVFTFFARK